MRRRYDEGERPDLAKEFLDVHTAASLLKLYFRELPEPVIPFEHFESFLNLATSFKSHSNEDKTLKSLQSLVRQIPEENYKLLDYLTAFLHEISKHQHINKMTEKNIALIFGTNILRGLDQSPEFEMATQNLTTHVVLALLEWHNVMFTKDTNQSEAAEKVENGEGVLVSLLDEPDAREPPAAIQSPPVVHDLIDLAPTHSQTDKPLAPPPIPARVSHSHNQSPNDSDSISTDSGLSKDLQFNSSNTSIESGPSGITTRPTPAPRGGEGAVVKKRQGSVKTRSRPTGILEDDKTSSPPANRRSGSLPITRVERSKSNFTSFIDSPLNPRVSLNIGDLPSSVDDLQALVLSLKLQMKDKNVTIEKLQKENESLSVKHRQQMESLASEIFRERQAKDDALAKVVMLTNKLAQYQ